MRIFCCCLIGLLAAECAAGEPLVVDARLYHLRGEGPREWSEFSQTPDAAQLEAAFTAEANAAEWTLELRQQDVKEAWRVSLNGRPLGRLERDENDMRIYLALPPGAVQQGDNKLLVAAERQRAPDDIRVGQLRLHRRSRREVLGEATLQITVVDADAAGQRLPSRITVVDADGALQTSDAVSGDTLAVRPGTIYTSAGQARFGLPAGTYTVYAGRGFEYSLDAATITLGPGASIQKTLSLSREVPTAGYVACDTHVHSLTHSGHGDATVQERMITLAAEGIELPIATDHNVHVDHEPYAREMQVRQYFTPVIGNEVTTPVGHFNIFPVRAGAAVPAFKLTDWQQILDGIYATPDVRVAILNHGRDLHSNVRPLGAKLFNDVAGENLDGWAMRFNAMEVVNSSATQTDPLRLFYDWMALLNRGRHITPVGSSDSHDVARHFVGQGRTYIRCDDREPGAIDVAAAVDSFLQGRVLVSYGLAAELTVDGKYRSGDLARLSGAGANVQLRVLGPHWVTARRVMLFANGSLVREATIPREALRDLPAGVKWQGGWSLPPPPHDVHLVALAVGPGIDQPYWKTAKPYQPTSPQWEPRLIGCSGAVWLDADGDGRATPAHEYARSAFAASDGDLPRLLDELKNYDRAVAAQAAHLYQAAGSSLLADDVPAALRRAPQQVAAGFRDYIAAWRTNQQARSRPD